jgi:tRNA 2-selenouridine synthase
MMPELETIDAADPESLAPFDAIIDVRSPGEFAEDHVPGAVNLPVLDNDERARVGTIYVQDSPFRARRIGAALVARNVARHLETALADKPGGFRPLIYCWRGGQRSGAMATILSQVGWRTAVLRGGYKTYRRGVQRRLYDQDLSLDLVLLDGPTGSGKTAILARLPALGVQVIDLEGLAEHRGSLFGGIPGRAQPSQKLFESRLLSIIQTLDPKRPVVVEAESSKIGDRMTPPALWRAMASAPRITIEVPLADRVRYLVEAYADVIADQGVLAAAIARLPVHPGRQRIEDWTSLAAAGDWPALAEALMALHYDPAYARADRKDVRQRLGTIALSGLGEVDQDAAAKQVAARVIAGLPP